MIPKLSAPLVKDIRTGEGILEYGLAGVSLGLALAGDLGYGKAATVATIAMVSKGVRRGLVKLVAVQKGVGIAEPILPAPAGVTPDEALAEIAAVTAATDTVQAAPGTPAEQVTAGLAPDPPAA